MEGRRLARRVQMATTNVFATCIRTQRSCREILVRLLLFPALVVGVHVVLTVRCTKTCDVRSHAINPEGFNPYT